VRRWVAGCAVAMSLATLAACAPATGSAPAAGGAPQNATTTTTRSGGSKTHAAADCTKATKVVIAPGAGFSPSKLTIQRGGFLAIVNKSDTVHALASVPDAGIVSTILDAQERQVVQFPKAGTFEVQSAAAQHPVLRVTVSGESGCGAPKPTLEITGAAAGHYSFSPKSLTVAATQNFAVVNRSNVAQTVVCAPDPGGNGDNSKLDPGETQLLAIDKPGRYDCSSVQHANAKVTVTVN